MAVHSHRDYRITKNPKVGPAALPIYGIAGVRITQIEMGHQCRSEVTACRRADDADTVRINLPFGRIGANKPDGAGSIFEHPWMPVTVGAEPILHHEATDAVGRKPVAIVFSFIGSKPGIAAARKDHHRCARSGFCVFWENRCKGRNIFIFLAESTRSALRPEWNRRVGLGLRHEASCNERGKETKK